MTPTDATLAEIEARAETRKRGGLTLTDFIANASDDIDALIAALRASRERERRSRSLANTWESQADGYPAEGDYAAVAVRRQGRC